MGRRTVAAGVAAAVLAGTGAGACSGGGGEGEPLIPRGDAPARSERELEGHGGHESSAQEEEGEGDALPAELTGQRLAWEACPAPSPVQGAGPQPGPLPDGTAWRCAELTVPVDYDEPRGRTLRISVIRARSSVGAGRIGPLVFNFGGPGGSGVATLPRVAERYETLREGFDLVSFDPRGVGESAGVVCATGAETDAAGQRDDGPPQTPAEERQYLADLREHAGGCAADGVRGLLPHLTTENTARDLDLLRSALGEPRLHYFGVSYGTKLGAVYAHLFPQRVGRAVLDSVVDPTRNVVERLLLQTEGFQRALDNYLADCAAGPDCPAGDGGAEGHRILNEMLDGLADRPLPTGTGRELTRGLAVTALLSLLYSEGSWPYLTNAVREARQEGRGDLLLAAAERYNGRDDQGRYRNLHAANTAINCADFASRPGLSAVQAHGDAFAAASPVFGKYLVWGLLACEGRPVVAERDQPRVRADGARRMLLLATTGDPATPYEGAARMQQALGGADVAALLSYDGEGHGAYGSGNACVVSAVHAHLLAGATPDDGTVCS